MGTKKHRKTQRNQKNAFIYFVSIFLLKIAIFKQGKRRKAILVYQLRIDICKSKSTFNKKQTEQNQKNSSPKRTYK